MSDDLLALARRIIKNSGKQRPQQAYLKRAVSTAYYGVFHAIAKNNADSLLGVTKSLRSEKAWQQTYRALQHGFAKSACKEARNLSFPTGIQQCATSFVALQEKRHSSDYDPLFRLTKQEALDALGEAKAAIKGLKNSPIKDRRAFAAFVLFSKR